MPDINLARRDGVELVRTGRFQTLTGSWNPTPADIKAAVEAMNCPAIRKPVIRLGHTDRRFVGDGEPALGWFENLRATDDGHTLVADQVTLPWLHSVQAAAYPSRSIEGNYHHRCSEGHVHPFVIHTVALLGVTPPGVQTLRSLNDLPDMLGVAASGEVPEGAEHVQVTILAAQPGPDGDDDEDDEPTGVMVALIPTADDAARLVVAGGEPAERLHLTLAYLGGAADLDAAARQDLIDAVSTAVNGLPVVNGMVFSAAIYNPGDALDRDACLAYQVSGDLLDAVHDAVEDALGDMETGQDPWFAHITANWTSDLTQLGALVANMGPVSFDRLRIAIAGQTLDIPLIDTPMPERVMVDYGGDGVYAANAPGGGAERLKKYWLAGPGLAKWADKPHPWTALYRQLLKYIKNPDEAKRTASLWYREHFGHTPNQKGVKASEVPPTPDLPAAEPEQENNPDPKEDFVSTDLSAFRSRLGLSDDADEQTILSALDELKAKADTPTQPTPEMVAASAAATEKAEKAEAEKDELRKEVTVLASHLQQVTAEVAAAKAEKAASVKASVLDEAVRLGKFTPAEREQWETDYDQAPAAITRVLASIAPGTAVPVAASGTAGSPEPTLNLDDDALTEAFFGPGAAARFKTQEA